ncbi:pyridoxal-phosphate dependent enzyme, partial [uncultured Corynebacterium sp.]|uniref:pyridoxal-phosphate dependent enzyme n=1 Tax=uncultured Corynebacterium sp. TaxID=159447 RepID=UPI00338E5769
PRHIRDSGLPTRAVAVDADGSVLFGGARGERILPGYGAGVVTELSRETVPDEVIRVSARDAVAAARRCARATGFLPGASGGAVCVGVEKLARENEGAEMVAVFHDDGRAYLDTIYNDEWVERNVN